MKRMVGSPKILKNDMISYLKLVDKEENKENRFFVLHGKETNELSVDHGFIEKVVHVIQEKIDKAKNEDQDLCEEIQMKNFVDKVDQQFERLSQEIAALKNITKS